MGQQGMSQQGMGGMDLGEGMQGEESGERGLFGGHKKHHHQQGVAWATCWAANSLAVAWASKAWAVEWVSKAWEVGWVSEAQRLTVHS